MLITLLVGCTGTTNTTTTMNFESCKKIRENKNYDEFYTFSASLPPGSVLMGWGETAQCIKTETGLDVATETSDVAKLLYATDEREALCIAKKYNATHIAVTEKLIPESSEWTQLASGKESALYKAQRSSSRQQQNSTVHTYPLSASETFMVVDTNGSFSPFLQQNDEIIAASKFYYFDENGKGDFVYQLDGQLPGTVWIHPTLDYIIYIPEGVERSVFTKLFLLDSDVIGFTSAKIWDDEIKLFEIKYPVNLEC